MAKASTVVVRLKVKIKGYGKSVVGLWLVSHIAAVFGIALELVSVDVKSN